MAKPTISKTSCNKFCAIPWNELVYTSQYNYGVCCKWQDDGNLIATSNSATDHYHSDRMADLRQRMINGEDIPECSPCWEDEANGKFSMRNRRNQHYYGKADLRVDSQEVESIIANTVNGMYSVDNLHGMHISTGDKCQLRCIDCSPAFSRSIYKDYERLGWDKNFKARRVITTDRKNNELAHWQSIKDNSRNLKIIRLTGGEPSINTHFVDYLNWCVDQGIAQDVEIHLPTNCVNIKPALIEPLTHFKKTMFSLSVDGVGDLDEYLRYPTNWNKKVKHIEQLIDLFPYSGIHTVVYSLNVLQIDQLFHWGQQFPVVHNFEMLNYPEELSVRHLPNDLKQQALEKIHSLNLDNANDFTKHSVLAVADRLQESGDLQQWNKCKEIIKAYDSIRKKSLHNIIAEFKKIG